MWLVFLELTALRCLVFQFNFDYHVTLLNVLWALGWSMTSLSVLIYLPLRAIAILSVAVMGGHNLLDGNQSATPLWSILHRPNFILNVPGHAVFVAYPLVPWIGVMAAGFSIGRIYTWTEQRRRAVLLRAGLSASALFLILRAINVYGDPVPWSTQASTPFTALSFLNTNKYPPSLLFLLMTLGPALLFLWAVDGRTPPVLRPALTFGRVPLFFFMFHIPFLHLIATAVSYARYSQVHWMFESPTIAQLPFTFPPGWGLPLAEVYLVWICVILAMYPLCRWFAAIKGRHPAGWLSYV